MTPSLTSTAPLEFPLPLPLLEFAELIRGPDQGDVSFCWVRLTGAGANAAVKLVFRPGLIKTDPPPAPTAEVFGAVKGTYRFELSGPGITPVRFVRTSELETFKFLYPVLEVTKEKTFERVLCVTW